MTYYGSFRFGGRDWSLVLYIFLSIGKQLVCTLSGSSAPCKLAGAPRAGIEEIGTRPLDWKHQNVGILRTCDLYWMPISTVGSIRFIIESIASFKGCAYCKDFLPLKCSSTQPSASNVISRNVLSLSQRHKTSKVGGGVSYQVSY